METLRICLGCQTPLTSDAPQGLCPACLLKEAMQHTATAVIGSEAAGGPAPRLGEKFGDYRILRLLGRGGMGEVYEAEHEPTGRRVALKVMGHALNSDTDRKRFLREGRLAASISHPHVVYVFGSEEIAGRPVIAMELVQGGTLRDRVRKDGSLKISEAVEATLQMIDGLEAAHKAGILHRDIKPANCFVSPDGAVKVGDFGLSISTIARGESLLTASGSVLGTPTYASPEQLRGEELDVASDIYSVGASLYYMVTGRPPHEAQDLVKLITEVLDKAPPNPRQLRSDIPKALARVIMRCLAKDRTRRFKDYAVLRDALLPFTSVAATPATVGLRFVAGLIDELIAFGPSYLVMVFSANDPLQHFVQTRTLSTFGVWIIFFAWYILYYAVPEGLRGAALGKTICRLRVVGSDRQPPGVPRALGRALIFASTYVIPSLLTILFVSATDLRERVTRGELTLMDWVWLPLWLLLFATMRRANGYAAIHDLASNTRVVTREAVVEREKLFAQSEPVITPSPIPKCGIYNILGVLADWGAEKVLLGHDQTLRRNVWIHVVPPGTGPVSVRRRDVSRSGRLRWLNGIRSATEAWDAYEAIDGAAFLNLARSAQPWSSVRFWLLDLAEELDRASDDGAPGSLLNPDRVWINARGHAVLLEFPAPGVTRIPPSSPVPTEITSTQQFLHEIAATALGHETNRMKLPLHAQTFLTSLRSRAFEAPGIIIGNLKSLSTRVAGVSRQRRLATLTLIPFWVIVFGLVGGSYLNVITGRFDRKWIAEYPDIHSVRIALQTMEHEWDDEVLEKPFEVHVAGHYRHVLTNETFWDAPETVALFDASLRRKAMRAIEKYPNPTAEELAAADKFVRPALDVMKNFEKPQLLWLTIGMSWFFMLVVAAVDLVIAAAFRQTTLLRPFGLTVVTTRGESASRLRLLWRAIIAWLPLLAGTPFVIALIFAGADELQQYGPILAGLLTFIVVIWLAAVIWTVLRPSRAAQDWLSGTIVVPR
jgi:eukaryotic-like serine/threonine-protein kinase